MPQADTGARLRPDEPLRILLLLSSLHGGGAERVAALLHRRLGSRGFDVRMGLLRASGPYLSQIDHKRLLVAPDGDARFDFDGSNRAQFTPAKLLRGVRDAPLAFRAMIEQVRPYVVLSFLKGTNLIVWRALAGMPGRPRWIAREGNNALAVIAGESPFGTAWANRAITARAYRAADRVLAISEALARDLRRDFGLAHVAAIHNPVDLATIREAAAEQLPQPPRPFILAVGRLEWQKGFDLLLDAYAASGAATTHDLTILGQGSLEAALKAQTERLGIAHAVRWGGFQANPFAFMAAADLFVLSSRWEGFGNVVAEAQAAGAPVLSTACDYGPPEIVDHGISGWLVEPGSAAALEGGLRLLLSDGALRLRLRVGATRSVERFSAERIVDRYAALLAETARG